MPAGLDGNPNPIVTDARTRVIESAADLVIDTVARPLLIAVDGIDGAGKSTFADELGLVLRARDATVVRSTIDWFHHPRAVRRRRGDRSAIGFYEDSHDLDALRARLLDPWRAGPGREYREAAFDEPSDRPLDPSPKPVEGEAILLFDGIFLGRPELAGYWDLRIFLDGEARVHLGRLGLVLDDVEETMAPEVVIDRTLRWVARIDRYASGMRIYLDSVDPMASADLVIDNNDLAAPRTLTAEEIDERRRHGSSALRATRRRGG